MGVRVEALCASADDGDAGIEARAGAALCVQAGREDAFSLSEGGDSASAEAAGAKSERGDHSKGREALRYVCVRWLPFAATRRQRRLGVGRGGAGFAIYAAGRAQGLVSDCAGRIALG